LYLILFNINNLKTIFIYPIKYDFKNFSFLKIYFLETPPPLSK